MSRIIANNSPTSLTGFDPLIDQARDWRDRALVLDTETTGPSNDDEVIELAIVRAGNGEVLFNSLFRPTKPVHPQAAAIHGLGWRDLKDSPRWADKWNEIADVLRGHLVLAWNVSFDKRMIQKTSERYRCKDVAVEWDCLMKMYKRYMGIKTGGGLEDACCALAVRKEDNHRALGDSLAAARVLYKIANSEAKETTVEFKPERTTDAKRESQFTEADFDELLVTARDFLLAAEWSEQLRDETSYFIDPMGGKHYTLAEAMKQQQWRLLPVKQKEMVLNSGGSS